jgi:hypothetical protein
MSRQSGNRFSEEDRREAKALRACPPHRVGHHRWAEVKTRLTNRPLRVPALTAPGVVALWKSGLQHDPEKWIPVFGKDHAPAKS